MCNMSGNSAYDGYGVINKALWRHKIFDRLPPEYKLLFLYLIAGPETQPSGLFIVDSVVIQRVMQGSLEPKGADEWLGVLEGFELITAHAVPGTSWFEIWVHGMFEAIKDTEIRVEAVRQVAKMAPGGLRDDFGAKHQLDLQNAIESNLGAIEPIVAALCKVTVRNVELLSNRDRERMLRIGKHYTSDDIIRLYGYPNGKWYTHDWRGRKRPPQKPNLSIIEAEIAKLDAMPDTLPPTAIDKELLIKTVYRLQAQPAKASEAKQKIVALAGEGVWDAMRERRPWSRWTQMLQDETRFEVLGAIRDVTGQEETAAT